MQIALTGSSFILYKHGHGMCVFTPVEPGAKEVPITPSKYRHHSAEIIARVQWAKERFLIVKRRRKLAWIRPVEDLSTREKASL
jgi:hypothetical protein